jgi:histidinol dehydrogenase
MINIYDLTTAQKTILKRVPLTRMEVSPEVQARLEALFGEGATPTGAVAQILKSIEEGGDAALHRWSKSIDGFDGGDFLIPETQLETAYRSISSEIQDAMSDAIQRVQQFHQRQPVPNWETGELGGVVGQRWTPVDKVGVYVPGGTAPLPSSVYMTVIPAQVAGVKEIILCTPPDPHPSILACAHLCGISWVYQLGGAMAIGAMTFGTETVPRVDKIVGAGNLFVTLAKQQVFGLVGLDGLAGPTETMVIADESANPAWVAADMLAQAEHDVLATAILLTPSEALARAVQVGIGAQIEDLSRNEIILESLSNRGGIVLIPDTETAARLANEFAPEHLCLSVKDPHQLMALIDHAGGFFLGERSFEVLGDYVAGPSHVMPTGGTARFASPLNLLDFMKISSVIALDEITCQALSATAEIIAMTEKLTAHAGAARKRIESASMQEGTNI